MCLHHPPVQYISVSRDSLLSPLQLSLLDTHIQQLQKQLQLVTGVNEREDPFLVLGNHTHPNNPLHPQEQVMNKYAVVVS